MPSLVYRSSAFALALLAAGSLTLPVLPPAAWAAPNLPTVRLKDAVAPRSPLRLTEDVRKAVLANGLTVLLKQVKTAPAVTVQVWYRVGSRNERPGITGISHQLEHLLFKGTRDRPIQFGRLFSALGSSSNAFTSYDMTAYYGTVSPDKLEALLVLESDRMTNALVGAEQLESERTVVLSELDGGNNNPGTRLFKQVMAAAFPTSNYRWPVIGDRQDVESYTADQVRDYYRTYYRPDNATLIVAGNFDEAQALGLINATFGKIDVPPAPLAQPLSAPSAPAAASLPAAPIVLKEPGSVPQLLAIYPTLPPIVHPDVPAIDLLDSILTSGKSSRFYQALVETGIASSAGASASTMRDPGWYSFSGIPAKGKTLADLDRAIQAEITKVQREGVTTAELDRARTQFKASYILGNRDIISQAFQLGYSQTVAGDYRFSDRYLAALDKVTPADVQRVAQQYLVPDRRVVGYFEPTVVTPQAASDSASTLKDNFTPATPVDPSEVAKYLPPSALQVTGGSPARVTPERFVLPNGLTVFLWRDRSSPAFTLVGEITSAGTGFDSPAKAGLADLVAQNLDSGTKTKTELELAAALENRGASLSFAATREGVDIAAVGLAADLPVVVRQLADVLQNATFPSQPLEISRKRNLVALASELDSPATLARRTFQSTLFPPGHPYHAMRSQASLSGLTREDLVAFYRRHYRPDTTTLVVMGDFDPEAVKALLRQSLGSWRASGQPPQLVYPPVPAPRGRQEQILTLAGKTQAITLLGHPGILRRDRRYDAALVLNHALGGDTLSSRLGAEIRDRQGLTYGIYSYFQAGKGAGQFVVSMQTSGKDRQKAVEQTLALLQDVRDRGITLAELEAAKRSLINSFPVDLVDPDNLAEAVLDDASFGFPVGHFYDFPQRIRAVTLEDANRAARELLHPDNLVVVTVTPD